MKTAIVIGATGLIGNETVLQLLNDPRYIKVKIFVRKSSKISNPKLEEYIVNFDKIEEWKSKLTGDELYSCMGTTIKKAGSQTAQFKIDYTYQYESAKYAAQNGVNKLFLVSSAGADPGSKNFYLRMKGTLDRDIQKLGFKYIYIFRPSILRGQRNESRFGEKLGIALIGFFVNIIPPIKKYAPIEGSAVAKAMIFIANSGEVSSNTYTLDEISRLIINSTK